MASRWRGVRMEESKLEHKFVKAVESIGGLAPKWVSPGARGVPDRIAILPGNRIAFVELKAPRENLKPLQEWWAEKLRARGHAVYKIDSEAGIDFFIEDAKNGRI